MNKKILFVGLVIIIVAYMYSASAEECSASISGKIDFGQQDNSAAINATIQIVGALGGLLNYTETDENGFYAANISFMPPSKSITIKMIKKDAYSSEGRNFTWIISMNDGYSINCGDNISINYSIEKCLAAIPYKGSLRDENFTNINETDEGEDVKIHLAVIPKDGKGVYKESTNFTKTDENSSAYALSVDTYTFWPMNLYLWADPTKNYYYRVYDDEKFGVISFPNFTSSAICGSSTTDITKNFIRFSRKNVSKNCSYNDECKSNLCYNGTCNASNFCTNNSWCNTTTFCNLGNNMCLPKKDIGENCSADYECLSGSCDITCQGYTYYKDADNDGYGDSFNVSNRYVSQSDNESVILYNEYNYTKIGGDCNDTSNAQHPGATEIYNLLDDNCNSKTDECSLANSSVNDTLYCNENATMQLKEEINASCSASYECLSNTCNNYSNRCLPNITNFCYNNSDCVVSNFCNLSKQCQQKKEVNTNCSADYECFSGSCNMTCQGYTYYKDVDNDGYGDSYNATNKYIIPTDNGNTMNYNGFNYTKITGDCNDSNPAIHPNATEIYNGIDDNCNSKTDECSPANYSVNDTLYCNENTTMQLKEGINAPCSASYECSTSNCNNYSHRCLPNITNFCYSSNDCCNSSSFNNGSCSLIQFCSTSNFCQNAMFNSNVFNSNITNGATVSNSTINNSNLNNSTADNSYIDNSTANNSIITNSTANNSILYNSTVSGSNITNGSTLNNSTASNSNLNNTIVLSSNITNNSTLYNSTVYNSIINNSTALGSSITNNSALYNSTANNSIITNSTINNSILYNSTASGSSIKNGSTLNNSTVSNSYINNSTISNSNIANNSITNNSTSDNSNVSSSAVNSSYIFNSTINNSVLSNSTITNSDISNSNITNSTITFMNLQNVSITNNVMETGILKTGNWTYKVNASGLYINGAYYSDGNLNLSKDCNTDADCYNGNGFCDPLHQCRTLEILLIYPAHNKILNFTPTINVFYEGAVNSTVLEFTFPNGTTQNLTANISKGVASFSLPSSLQNGTYKFKAYIFDVFGNNKSSELLNFAINTSAINIDYTNTIPKQNAFISKNFTVEFQSGAPIAQIWAVIKNEATNETTTIFLNYTSNQMEIYSAAINTENLFDGNYTITVYANDTNGNIGCAGERTITIDNTKPYALINISVSEYSANLTLNFNEKSNLTFCYWKDTTFTNCSSYPFALFHTLNLSNLQQNETYHFNATFCDLAGNCNFTTGNFTTKPTDITPPSANISIPATNKTNTSTIININFSENTSLTLRYGTNSSDLNTTISYSTFNTTYSLNIQNLASNQKYFLNLTYCDNNGNCNSTFLNFSTLKGLDDICSSSDECYNSKCLYGDATTKLCSPSEWECRSKSDCVTGNCNSNHKCYSTYSGSGSSSGSSGGSSGGSPGNSPITVYSGCGDKICSSNENCNSCPTDCGKCIICGDKICEGNETYLNCPTDCKKQVICGDKICEGNETYLNCQADCKKPIICGDKICEGNESYSNCPADCPKLVICGDKICEGNETCETCVDDCGKCVLILTVPSKLKEGDKFVAKVTTKDGKPVENAKVSYGNLTKYTNASGEVMLTALGNVNKIEVGKENYSVSMENLNIEKAKPQTEILFLIAAVLLIVILSLLFALLRKRNKKDEKSEEKAAEVEEEEKPKFAGEGGLGGLSNVRDVKDEEKQDREKGGLGGLNY